MLQSVMPSISVSDLRTNHSEVYERLHSTSLRVTSRSHGDAVLVHPRIWNKLVETYYLYRERDLESIEEEGFIPFEDHKQELIEEGLLDETHDLRVPEVQ